MPCREQELSDSYAELLLDYVLTTEEIPGENNCFEIIDDQFGILYINQNILPPISVTTFVYNSIPKVYGLMQDDSEITARSFDPLSLVRSGVLQVQRPPLSLTGRGVVLGFVDTGERVKIMRGQVFSINSINLRTDVFRISSSGKSISLISRRA